MALERSVKCGICGKPDDSFVHCDLIRGLACMQCCEQCVHSHKFEGVTRCAYPLVKRNKKKRLAKANRMWILYGIKPN